MKNYFIVGLTSEEVSRLQSAQVEFCDLEIDNQTGVVIDSENIQPALTAIEKSIGTETNTSLEGIVKVSLTATAATTTTPQQKQEFAVQINESGSEFRCDHWRDLATKLQKWMSTQICNVNLLFRTNIEQYQRNKGQPGELDILIGQGEWNWKPENFEMDQVEGYKVTFVPGGYFIRISGFPDCPNDGHSKALSIILEHFLPIVVEKDEIKRQEFVHKLKEERLQKSREKYQQECSKRFEKTVKGTCDKIANGKKEIERLQQLLVKTIRETSGAERKLEQLEATRPGQLDSYGKEFDSLLSVPGVENVETADGVIKVFTEHIYITPDNCADTFDIGKFRMEIYTSGQNGGIRFFNLTNNGEGPGYTQPSGFNGNSSYNRHHPHVQSNGSACLGNIQEMIAELVGSYEYTAIAQLALQYLQSVNTDDSAGNGIYWWPKVERKGGEKIDAKL